MKKLLIAFTAFAVAITVISCSGKGKNGSAEDKKGSAEKSGDEVVFVQPDFVKSELDEKFGTDEVYIVKTVSESPAGDVGRGLYITKTHYQLSDGTWKTDEYSYKYKLIVTGRLNNAVNDSTYHILSNRDNITFDEAWKASGLSSNSEDYFKPEDAIIVAFE